MKNQLKNYLKILFILFGISLLLLNCEDVQDDSPIKNPSIINEKINFSIIPNGNSILEKVIDIKQKINKLHSKYIEDLNLDNQNVLMLQDEGQEFPIYIINILDGEDNLTNQKLLLRRVEKGYYASIFTFITDGEASFSYGNYTGNIIKTNLEDKFIYNVQLNNSVVENVETNSDSNSSKTGNSETCYATLEYYACPYGYYHSDAECISTGAYYEIVVRCIGGTGEPGTSGTSGSGDNENTGGGGNGGSGNGDESYIPDCGGADCNEECAEDYEKDLFGNCIPICGRDKVRNTSGSCECIDGMEEDNNGECVVKIINNLTGKAKCVYEKLKNQNGDLFKTTIGRFIDNPDYHLQLNSGGSCNTGEDACTDDSNIASGLVVINIISELNGTLDLAALILHEGIHAELYKYVYEYNQGVDPQNRPNLLGYYFQYQNINIGTAQHQHMADKFVKPIAEALRTLDNNNYPLEDYMSFAWDGLRKYGWDGYYNNGEYVTLDRNTYSSANQNVLNNTEFNNDCN